MTPRQACYFDAGILYYRPAGGKLHRKGCRYFVAPGPGAVITQPNLNQAFWDGMCRLCKLPDGPARMPIRLEKAISGSCTVNIPGCTAKSATWVVPVMSARGKKRHLATACYECLHNMMDLEEWVEA